MTEAKRIYLLDANVFIQAKNQYYSFAVCPGFWEALDWLNGQGAVFSVDRVKDELLNGNDELSEWAKSQAPDSVFRPTSDGNTAQSFSEMMEWVENSQQFTQQAKAAFARGADG